MTHYPRLMGLLVACVVAAAAPAHAAPQASGYDALGRRDPFVSLVTPKPAPVAASASAAPRPIAGLPGLAIKDAVVKGILRIGATAIAILEAPDGKTFIAHAQDRLRNGLVREITADSVVFVENVADDRGHVIPREVRKPLHAAAGAGR